MLTLCVIIGFVILAMLYNIFTLSYLNILGVFK
jgi:hypothetical protein